MLMIQLYIVHKFNSFRPITSQITTLQGANSQERQCDASNFSKSTSGTLGTIGSPC